jgi:hypothetical protein
MRCLFKDHLKPDNLSMNRDSHRSERAQQRELLSQGQAQLSQAFEQVLVCLRDASAGRMAKQLVDLSVVLRKHKHVVTDVVSSFPGDATAARYLELLNQLRREVAVRMTLLASGVREQLLTEEFETLGWRTLSHGVLWLDALHQASESQPQPLSLVGEHWARARGSHADQAPMAISINPAPEEDEAIDIDQILYCSLASTPMTDAQIDALAQSAERLNRLDKISGMLMHGDGVFVQLIEGPRDAINQLWARLLKDKRHCGVVQLYHRREVESRSCKGWGMQYVEREHLQAIVHEAKEEIIQGRKTVWAPAIERMDYLLSQTSWAGLIDPGTAQATQSASA